MVGRSFIVDQKEMSDDEAAGTGTDTKSSNAAAAAAIEHSPYEKMSHDTKSWTVPTAWNKKSVKVGGGGKPGGGKKGTSSVKGSFQPSICSF